MSSITLALILLSTIGFLLGGLYAAYLLLLKKPKNSLRLLLGGWPTQPNWARVTMGKPEELQVF